MPPDGETIDAAALQRENAELKASLDAARRQASEDSARAESLDAQVTQASARAATAQVAQLTAQETAAIDALSSIEQEIKGLKQQWASLQAEGKFDEAADVSERLGDATARRRQASQAKDYYAQQKTQVASQPTDPVEQFLAANQGSFTPEDINWIRQNPRYARDSNFRQRVIRAHSEALEKGVAQRSPDYYKHLENAGYMRPEPALTGGATEQRQEQEAQSASAPTGHTGGDATSDTGAQSSDDEPEIIIREAAMAQNNQAEGPAFGRAAERPQPRAAGTGAMRAAIAGSPSRRPIGGNNGRRTVLEMTPGERETALAMAPHMAGEDVLKGGEPAVLQWYHELKSSPTAERIRQGWVDRRG